MYYGLGGNGQCNMFLRLMILRMSPCLTVSISTAQRISFAISGQRGKRILLPALRVPAFVRLDTLLLNDYSFVSAKCQF